MSNLSYEESKKKVFRGLWLLAGVTLFEVAISLFGKGHIGGDFAHRYSWLLYVVAVAIIILSLYKAYFIIYEFMHMRYEVRSLALTVLLPTVLLVWAIIAFFQEGGSWKDRREQIKEKNELPANEQGMAPDTSDPVYRWG